MSRPILTAVNHFSPFPFDFGGALGIRGLYKALSEWFDINIITFSIPNCYPKELYINKHIRVINIVLPSKLTDIQKELCREYGMTDTFTDLTPVILRWYHKFPEIVDAVKRITKDSEIVLAEHVFTWNLIKTACKNKHLWYRANNVEYDYKLDIWGDNECPKDFLQEMYDVERECCLKSEKILAVSSLEIDRFMSLYHLPEEMKDKFMDIHSGYDVDDIDPVLPSQRKKLFDQYDYAGLFIASDAPHQRKAASYCIEIAKARPNIMIVLLGSIGKACLEKELPKNVLVTGIVTDKEKRMYEENCDFALNIMEDGAGINIKMFEYMAFGIPIVATAYGARGIDVDNGKSIILTDTEHLIDNVDRFCKMTVNEKDEIAKKALQVLKDKYSWRSIGRRVASEIERLYNIPVSKYAVPLEEIKLYKINQEEIYLPKKPFYIRCAGIRGQNCYATLKHLGYKAIAFVDESKKYVGKDINGVPVVSMNRYIEEKEGTEIIVANANNASDIAVDLIKRKVSPDDISLSPINAYITKLTDNTVKPNSYYDASGIKEEILRRAKEEGAI